MGRRTFHRNQGSFRRPSGAARESQRPSAKLQKLLIVNDLRLPCWIGVVMELVGVIEKLFELADIGVAEELLRRSRGAPAPGRPGLSV
jgi:hypothetical protein